jgi:sugar phosphate isomerase/epimerase
MFRLLAADWNHWPENLPMEGIARVAAENGALGLELGVYVPRAELAEPRRNDWDELLAPYGLSVRMLLYSLPPERWPVGALSDRRAAHEILDQLAALLDAAGHWAIDLVGVWPGADLVDADRDMFVESLRRVAEMAASRGIRVAFEPKPGTIIASPAQLVEMVQTAGVLGPLGILIDTGHEFAAGRSPEVAVREFPGQVLHVHLGDSDGDPDADLPPGAVHSLEPFFRELDAIGYDGYLTPDVYGAVARGLITGADALRRTRAVLDEFGASRTSLF